MEKIFFLLNNVLVLLTASVLSYRCFKERGQTLILLGISVLFPTIITLATILLGVFGGLYNFSFSILLFLILILSMLEYIIGRRRLPIPRRSLYWLCLLVILGAAGGYIAGRFIISGTHFSFDDFSYHAAGPGLWVKDHSILSGPFNYHYHNPMNAEILSFWWMLPFGQDGFVFLSGAYWLLVSASCMFILCRKLGLPIWLCLFTPLVLFFSQPPYYQAAWTFSAVDLAGPAMVLAGLTFLTFDDSTPLSGRTIYLFSGLACGLAVGSKVPFATVAVLAALWVFFRPGRSVPDRLKNTLLFCVGAALTGFFWYAKNMYLTGNPVFPGQLGPFAGPLTGDIQYSTKIIGLITTSGFSLPLIGDLFMRHLNWPLSLGILSLTGYLGAGVWLCMNRNRDRYRRRTVQLLLLAGISMLATYINMPFSGRFNTPDAPIQLSLRFVIGPFLIGILLYTVLMGLNNKAKWAFIVFFFICLAAGFLKNSFLLFYAITSLVAVIATVLYFVKPLQLMTVPITPCFLMLTVGMMGGLSMTFSYQQQRTDRNVFRYTDGNLDIGQAWKQLETFPPGTVTAILGPDSYQRYPLLGRHLQLNYRVLDESGQPQKRLYKRYRSTPEQTVWWPEISKTIQYPLIYLQNASESGVDCFIVIRYNNGTWPLKPDDFRKAGWLDVWQNSDSRIIIWHRPRFAGYGT